MCHVSFSPCLTAWCHSFSSVLWVCTYSTCVCIYVTALCSRSYRRARVHREEGPAHPAGDRDGLCGLQAFYWVCVQQPQHQGDVWLRRELQHLKRATEQISKTYPDVSTQRDGACVYRGDRAHKSSLGLWHHSIFFSPPAPPQLLPFPQTSIVSCTPTHMYHLFLSDVQIFQNPSPALFCRKGSRQAQACSVLEAIGASRLHSFHFYCGIVIEVLMAFQSYHTCVCSH